MTKPPSQSPDSISAAELLYADLNPDLAATRRVLERFPEGHADWRPHEKSRTLAELATHVANIPNLGLLILEADEMDATTRPRIAPLLTVTELLELFDKSSASLRTAVAATDFEALSQMWSIRAGPKVLITQPRRVMLRTLVISHIVHHRAQLGVYYRLLGVAVPGVYGPTADESPFA